MTRREILDAALEIVASGGPAALSLREVARRLGRSHQAPYRHFTDREAVLAALVEEGLRGLAEAMRGRDLPGAGEAYLRWAVDHPGHYRLLFRPDLVDLERYPDTRAAGDAAWAELAGHARQLPGDPDLNAAVLWSTVHGAATLYLDGPLRDPGLLAAVPRRLATALAATAAPGAGSGSARTTP